MIFPVVAALAGLAVAAPVVEKRAAVTDADILNYALTLENLENAFYKLGLSKFSEQDFQKAGLGGQFYNNLKEISKDETTHVSFLTGALQAAGYKAVAPCTYNFGFKDVPTFIAIANVLEGVGVSAYLGAAASIANPAYLTAAGSILTVEARHSAYLREHQSPAQSPFPFAFDTPLDFNEVYTMAAAFITSCPASNPPLPVKAFPSLTIVKPAGVVKTGTVLTVSTAKKVAAKGAWFITGSGPVAAKLSGSGKSYTVTVPSAATPGQEYVVLTKDTNTPTDDNIVAGPAVVQVADNAYTYEEGHGGYHWHGEGSGEGHGPSHY